jgi:hypothetical protein
MINHAYHADCFERMPEVASTGDLACLPPVMEVGDSLEK